MVEDKIDWFKDCAFRKVPILEARIRELEIIIKKGMEMNELVKEVVQEELREPFRTPSTVVAERNRKEAEAKSEAGAGTPKAD